MEIFQDAVQFNINGFSLVRENFQDTKMLSYHVPFYIRKSRRNDKTKQVEIYYVEDEISEHQRIVPHTDHIGVRVAEFVEFLETEVPEEFRAQTNKYNVERFKKMEDGRRESE